MRFKLIENILTEDIESMKKYYPNIDGKDFMKYIKLDPTYKGGNNAGTYAKWILGLANQGKLDNIGHVKDLLTRFEDNKKNLVNSDIMKYKSIDDVDNMLNDENSYKALSHRQEVRGRQKDRRNANTDEDLVFSGSRFDVYIPSSYANSCKLGQGAKWCTASTENDYYYNYYKDEFGGDYYILIDKNNPSEKYQFHFESGQFMDKEDEPVDIFEILNTDKSTLGYMKKEVPIVNKALGYAEKCPGIPSDSLFNFIRNIKYLKQHDITEEEMVEYILPGYANHTFVVFKNGVSSDVLVLLLPELDMGEYVPDYLFDVNTIKILDGVTEVDEEDFEELHDIGHIDFGNTLTAFYGDMGNIVGRQQGNYANIKLPQSLQNIDETQLYASEFQNIAIPSHLIPDYDLYKIIYIVTSRDEHLLNIFVDNTEKVKEANVDFIDYANRNGIIINIYPYEDYEKFVNDK